MSKESEDKIRQRLDDLINKKMEENAILNDLLNKLSKEDQKPSAKKSKSTNSDK